MGIAICAIIEYSYAWAGSRLPPRRLMYKVHTHWLVSPGTSLLTSFISSLAFDDSRWSHQAAQRAWQKRLAGFPKHPQDEHTFPVWDAYTIGVFIYAMHT